MLVTFKWQFNFHKQVAKCNLSNKQLWRHLCSIQYITNQFQTQFIFTTAFQRLMAHRLCVVCCNIQSKINVIKSIYILSQSALRWKNSDTAYAGKWNLQLKWKPYNAWSGPMLFIVHKHRQWPRLTDKDYQLLKCRSGGEWRSSARWTSNAWRSARSATVANIIIAWFICMYVCHFHAPYKDAICEMRIQFSISQFPKCISTKVSSGFSSC